MNIAFNKDKPIAIGADHAGFEYKSALIEILEPIHTDFCQYLL